MIVYSKAKGLRKLKEGVTLEKYQERFPDAIECFPPSMEELEDMNFDGIVETPCGCQVEPDGYCSHGRPSWLIVFGII